MKVSNNNHSSNVSFGEEQFKDTKITPKFDAFLTEFIVPFPNLFADIEPFPNDLKHLCNE